MTDTEVMIFLDATPVCVVCQGLTALLYSMLYYSTLEALIFGVVTLEALIFGVVTLETLIFGVVTFTPIQLHFRKMSEMKDVLQNRWLA